MSNFRLACTGRAPRAHPRGVWGHAPPETFWISDLLRSLLVQSGGEILRRIYGRRTCCAMPLKCMAWRTELCYFRSGSTRPSIITLTAFLPVAGPADPHVDQLS